MTLDRKPPKPDPESFTPSERQARMAFDMIRQEISRRKAADNIPQNPGEPAAR